jgi:hypothetical protein
MLIAASNNAAPTITRNTSRDRVIAENLSARFGFFQETTSKLAQKIVALEELDHNIVNCVGSIADPATRMQQVAIDFAQLQHCDHVIQVFRFAKEIGQGFSVEGFKIVFDSPRAYRMSRRHARVLFQAVYRELNLFRNIFYSWLRLFRLLFCSARRYMVA